MGKYILGIDGGTQSTKLVLFDLTGNIVVKTKVNLRPTLSPAPGQVEYQDDDLWTSLIEASKDLLAKFPGEKKDIIAIGLGSIRFCRTLLDENGHLAHPVISWLDYRVGLPQNEKETNIRYMSTATGYMAVRLTGNFRDTIANCLNFPIDKDNFTWGTDEQIKKFNLTRDMLFDLVKPGESLGTVSAEAAAATGLPEGIPVVATANDKAVEGLGAGLEKEDTLVISLGTYIASMVIGDKNNKNPKNYWVNLFCEPNKYAYESMGIWRGMSTISWFKDLLGEPFARYAKEKGMIPEEVLNQEAVKVAPGANGLSMFLDSGSPYQGGGVLLGIERKDGRAEVYRAILEGIALEMKKNVDGMIGELDRKINRIIVTGGGSNSDLLLQMIADVFNMPVSRNVINEAASLGAAICAAVYTKQYASFAEAIDHMVQIKDTFTPDPKTHEIYMGISSKRQQPKFEDPLKHM
ncbi:FGGY-family carbohydrate kinase [Lactobacillus sp. ESL0791]|uniref:FGGY-family carbohydrate kinase n=1 Tax=Lactobacillus sp. ESL0791 TaxID=2983234 RepID=UPI0023F9C041|nr:FGGY-family carbohydrate kinase [Lactobacillus sp. ESL0791]MDF7638079.1 FGGY-family carbohydrate kinase [Lactobacillus sp. ESL0791]